MKRNGFTLIELLAVIVILAIIAVIAVPIVINIIDDSKKKATLRSTEFYLEAVEMSISQATLKDKNIIDNTYPIKDGDICLNDNCTEILEVEVNGEVPKEGTITIKDGIIINVDFKIGENRVIKNSKGEIIHFPCTLIRGEANTIGSKYECEVSPGEKYNFYVLSYNEEDNISTQEKTKAITTNLIMDQNIYSDGTPAGLKGVRKETNETKYSLVSWNSSDSNTSGPVRAIQFLYNATKNWINIPALNYKYNDREFHNILDTNTTIGYISFVSNNGIATITPLTGESIVIGTIEEPLRVRMPIYSGVWNDNYTGKSLEKGELSEKTTTNAFLYENLSLDGVNPPFGYWTLSSGAEYSYIAWFVYFRGRVSNTSVTNIVECGVRPVINLKL